MKFSINPEMFAKYPRMRVGYVIAEFVNSKSHPEVEHLKASLQAYLKDNYNMDASNFSVNKTINGWAEVYKNFGVKPKEYPSSVTSLVRRVVKGQGIWNISTIVDLYNCHSVMGLTPMGGYDLDKVSGDVEIRLGMDGEKFLGLGAKEEVAVNPSQVVYVDKEGVICWLWNHKDCQRTMLTLDTTRAVFFFDCADQSLAPELEGVITAFTQDLVKFGAKIVETNILEGTKPSLIFLQHKASTEDRQITASVENESSVKKTTSHIELEDIVDANLKLGGKDRLQVNDVRLAKDENFQALSAYVANLKM